MGAKGTSTIDFGAPPGDNRALVVVTGQAGIAADSHVEAWMMGDATADHSADEHAMAPIKLTCTDLVAGTGFTIVASSQWTLTGAFAVRWVWD